MRPLPLLLLVAVSTLSATASDWPQWRGPERTGVADENQSPPVRWSDTENVIWKTPVPGRGHASPIILEDQIFLATADEERGVQLLLCYDRHTGQQRWEAVAHTDGLRTSSKRQPNEKATWASCTPVTDGDRIYVSFLSGDAVWLSAFMLSGERVWQEKVCNYVLHQGYGASPLIYDDLVIVTADNKGGGAIAAFARTSGKRIWSYDRPPEPNYPSPIVHRLDGRDQLIQTGCSHVVSLNPSTGELLWETEGATTECVTTTVTDGRYVFSSGGYPRDHVAAYATDGSSEVAWDKRLRVYVPSMLERDGYLYMLTDAGVAMCLNTENGDTAWKARLGGTFTSSPVRVGDRIYITNESGTTYIYRASPDGFEKIGENQLTARVYASPAICDSCIYARVVERDSETRAEFLICIGE